MASMGESSKRRVTSAYSSMVEPQTLAMKRVSLKSSVGRIFLHHVLDAGILQADGVQHARRGFVHADAAGCRAAALPVVPLSTMAPTSRFENPSTRVYSLPKPTQPDSSTMGIELHAAEVGQQRVGHVFGAAAMARDCTTRVRPALKTRPESGPAHGAASAYSTGVNLSSSVGSLKIAGSRMRR